MRATPAMGAAPSAKTPLVPSGTGFGGALCWASGGRSRAILRRWWPASLERPLPVLVQHMGFHRRRDSGDDHRLIKPA